MTWQPMTLEELRDYHRDRAAKYEADRSKAIERSRDTTAEAAFHRWKFHRRALEFLQDLIATRPVPTDMERIADRLAGKGPPDRGESAGGA